MQLLDTEVFEYFTDAELTLIKDKLIRYSLDERFYDDGVLIVETIIFT